jgi:cephalosporin-C deacetylase
MATHGTLAMAAICAASVFLAPQAPGAKWRVEVEAGITGAEPAVLARDGGTPQRLRARVAEVTTAGLGEVLVDLTTTPAELRLPMPAVRRDAFVEVALTTSTAAENGALARPFFRWRTLLRPGAEPELDYRGRAGYEAPADFDEFWERAKSELAAVPMRPVVTASADHRSSTGIVYRVELPTVEETTVVAWYCVPRAAFDESGKVARKYPALLSGPGYGGSQPPDDRTASGIITLAVNPRSHGPSREYWRAAGDNLAHRIDDPERCYYKLAILDCLRGAQFLFSRGEVDPARVGAHGGSQGGLFAVAVAALEPRIACAAANVPSWSAFADREVLATAGTQMRVNRILADAGTTAAAVRRSLALTDAANLATRVRCPLQVTAGGVDGLCPWPTCVVVHNRVPREVPRDFRLFPDAGHEVTRGMREANMEWFGRHLFSRN